MIKVALVLTLLVAVFYFLLTTVGPSYAHVVVNYATFLANN